MDEIIRSVTSELVPELGRHDMLLHNELYQQLGITNDYCLAEIPDFQSLLPQSHKFGIPVYALSDHQIERTGTVLEQMVSRRDDFNQMFVNFAEKIERIKEYVESQATI